MRLPNGDRAVVDRDKLVGYCLSFEHLRGQHKARVFLSALGLTRSHAEMLHVALLRAAHTEEIVSRADHAFGTVFVLDFAMEGPSGRAVIRSIWIVRSDEDFPRLVTCFVRS